MISFLIPARNSADSIRGTVVAVRDFLVSRYRDDFEIIVIPNGSDADVKAAAQLAGEFAEVRSAPHSGSPGKGAALRTGYRASRGDWIFFTDADLPYDLDFFDEAARKLRDGYDFVTGNRRLPNSHFDIPVSLLPLAYGRHRLGLWFNQVVRWLLPVKTTDTQSGLKAFTRRLAEASFNNQVCPGFFFDLEFFLTARGLGYRHAELPVTLHLNTEKSTVRVLRESAQAVYWLTRITLRQWLGRYGRPPRDPLKDVLSRYAGASGPTRFFLAARWHLTPYMKMARELPESGRILDLGCGHGLLSIAAALTAPKREVVGVDHDPERVRLASSASAGVGNLRFTPGGVFPSPVSDRCRAITLIDVMHYFDPELQGRVLKQAFEQLEPGGRLLVREVDPAGGLASKWNKIYEKIATGIGFTKSERESQLHFRSREGWMELLRESGFRVRAERCSSPLFADILYVCERP